MSLRRKWRSAGKAAALAPVVSAGGGGEVNNLLIEDGSFLLLEDGSYLLTEE